MTKKYQVVAVSQPELRISRHGINETKGGEELSRQNFQFPDTPYYLACEMVQDEFPKARVSVIQK